MMRIETINELPRVTIPKTRKVERSTFHTLLEEKHAQLSDKGNPIDKHSLPFTVPKYTEQQKAQKIKALQDLIQSLIQMLATDPSIPGIHERLKEARLELAALLNE